MKYFPYKLWLYWCKCGVEVPIHSDPRKINKRSLSFRLKSLPKYLSNRRKKLFKNLLINAQLIEGGIKLCKEKKIEN